MLPNVIIEECYRHCYFSSELHTTQLLTHRQFQDFLEETETQYGDNLIRH